MADATPDTAPNAGDHQLTLPVLPLPNGVVLPGMVLTIALESGHGAASEGGQNEKKLAASARASANASTSSVSL